MVENRVSLILLGLFFVAIQVTAFQEAHAFKFSKETCEKYSLGPNWYCEEEKKKAESLTSLDEIMAIDILPEQKAVLLNQLWETQQKRAVITRDKEDQKNVLKTQKYIAELSTNYALDMIRLTETMPEYGRDSHYQQISKKYIKGIEEEEVLRRAKDRFALAFIHASDCPYCERQVPILNSLKEDLGITLLGISVDGGSYPGLDQVIVDSEVIKNPNVQALPTIMLVDSKTNKRLFISKGLTTKDKLESLIYKKIKEVENE